MQTGFKQHMRVLAIFAVGAALAAGLFAWHELTLSRSLASRDLQAAHAALRAAEGHVARELIQRGESIARNQAVTGYIGQALDNTLPGIEPDYTSVVDLLEERREQMKLGMIAMLDAQGNVLATTDRLSGVRTFGESEVFRAASRTQLPDSGLIVDSERATHVLVMPLARYGFSDVYLMLGEPVGATFAQRLLDAAGASTPLDVALIAGETGAPRALSTSMPTGLPDGVLPRWAELRAAGPRGLPLDLPGSTRLAMAAPLFDSERGQMLVMVPAGGDAGIRAAARLPMIVGAVIALLALAIAAWWLQRKVFGPLDDLLRVAGYAAESGDLHLKAQGVGTSRIARLADAFNRICTRASQSTRD
ncbi:hypothetical protein [Lysobacter brunescens]|uniref:HAMP domain-containing protein n=1 Tax=Lysobacter brunescens TaxID=262323 RepID=A0ABW2YBF1_9GAMM